MNQQQTETVNDTTSPRRLVLAAAGSGKTKTLVADVVQALDAGTDPEALVVITFTNAAAEEFRARIAARSTRQPGYVGTLHGFCLSLVNRYGSAIGYKPGAVQMIDEETETLQIMECLKEVNAGAKWTVSKVREWKATGGIANPAAIAAKLYMKRLRAASCVDYDSVLFDALRLIQEGYVPPLAGVWVDEFQDSGPWDAAIYKALICQRLFVVGDASQSVYAFRGAVVRNIIDLAEDPTWKTYRLDTNYRCPVIVCEAANRLMQGAPTAAAGCRMTWPEGTPRGEIEIITAPTQIAEAAQIAGRLLKEEAMTTAILVRYNAQVPALVDALTAEGIRSYTSASAPRWLPVAISALNAIAHPENDFPATAWLRDQFGESLRAPAAASGKSQVQEAFKALAITDRAPEEQLGAMNLPDEARQAIVQAWPPGRSIQAVIQAIQEAQKAEEPDERTVYVGTLHSFKGRQAERIVLAGMADEIMPAKKTADSLEEERRLFYVGITRTEKVLWISYPEKYMPPFGKTYQPATLSRFAILATTTAAE